MQATKEWTASISVPLNTYAESERVFATLSSKTPATLPVPNPTASFWASTPDANPLAAEGSSGPLTQDADICIIGSGITGVSAAYHLAQIFGSERREHALKVVILEARDFC